ncbi:pterin-4-alpha-carbinolamine dehydratase 2, mitochondrial [Cajanus cajan]|nr:pterin-4-alpha-carbinolamine dehydratase 2, mitochondrial [Cajanus cajan]
MNMQQPRNLFTYFSRIVQLRTAEGVLRLGGGAAVTRWSPAGGAALFATVTADRLGTKNDFGKRKISLCSTRSEATEKKKSLTDKKCVPCNLKELRPMSEGAAHTLMPQVAEWNLVNDDGVMKLRRSWTVKTFTKGLEFFRVVAVLAESEGHHPDLHLVGWNNVTIEIWTHAVGGLTENDFILAAKIDKLDVLNLLRRKPTD